MQHHIPDHNALQVPETPTNSQTKSKLKKARYLMIQILKNVFFMLMKILLI